jgi:hypothetical protein
MKLHDRLAGEATDNKLDNDSFKYDKNSKTVKHVSIHSEKAHVYIFTCIHISDR